MDAKVGDIYQRRFVLSVDFKSFVGHMEAEHIWSMCTSIVISAHVVEEQILVFWYSIHLYLLISLLVCIETPNIISLAYIDKPFLR